ncbi:hypothetical protein F7725_000230 [Dissostichus mawsoni]|uniref:Uncharacterized protein n=1 Tax=Dissostichus mawsoni TaxID=36200 RepID=A0A7J5ZDS9_DISMA|nr:hypothetical protein F7725_000230 [Dissostichus mawsoni]
MRSRADGCRHSSRTSTHTIGGLRVRPRAGGRAAEIHTPPACFRGGRIASSPSENCGGNSRTTGHHRTGFRRGRLASSTGGSLWSRADGCWPSSRTNIHTIGGLGARTRAKSTAAENHASPTRPASKTASSAGGSLWARAGGCWPSIWTNIHTIGGLRTAPMASSLAQRSIKHQLL